MQPNEQKIQQILTMNQEDFTRLVYTVVLSATGDSQKAEMAMTMAPMIREKLKSTHPDDLNNLLSMVGEDKLQAILRSLG